MTLFLGKTEKGDGRGKTLGFPTINIYLQNEGNMLELQKNSGVFLVNIFLFIDDKKIDFVGLLHLGSRPTFQEKEFRIEVFVLEKFTKNIDDNKYLVEILSGTRVGFSIVEKLRDVINFDSVEKLVEQIKKDVKLSEKIILNNIK